jgi:hypothetical protein
MFPQLGQRVQRAASTKGSEYKAYRHGEHKDSEHKTYCQSESTKQIVKLQIKNKK